VQQLSQILRDGGANLDSCFWNKPECLNLVLEVYREAIDLNLLEDMDTIKRAVEMIFECFFVWKLITVNNFRRFAQLRVQVKNTWNTKNGS
jgi:hypothetical protein